MENSEWDGSLTALEARAEIDSLEDLQQRRRQLLPEYATLRALHGSNGKFDAKRKALLEAMKIRARMEMATAGEKITEAAVDARAHADDQYVRFIDTSIRDATRYVELETEVSEIEEKIRNREFCILAFNAETRLGR